MKADIEIITPVHVGSGIQYQGNAEYLYFADDRTVVVVDEAKILDIIGVENLHYWVDYIEEKKSNFLEYLKQRKPSLKPVDVAKRMIRFKGKRGPVLSNTLREQINTGGGNAYIPGSSIKGAIRTALFATELFKKYSSEALVYEKLVEYNKWKGKDVIDQKKLNTEVFGNSPNNEWMRMLHVSDVAFNHSTEAAFFDTLNEQANQTYKIKQEVKQLVEYIPAGRKGQLDIDLKNTLWSFIDAKKPDLFKRHSNELSIDQLCQLIHKHTLRLLENEIAFFEDADLPDEAADLPEFMMELLESAKKFEKNACLLRLGFGTGYRTMTGDWVGKLVTNDDDYEDIKTAVRRTSRYNDMPLPKTRKIIQDGILPGYIKLTFK